MRHTINATKWFRSTPSKAVMYTVLGAWAIFMTLICTIMMGKHSIPLPMPELSSEEVAHALGEHREETQEPTWMMTHVFLSTCPCSKRLADYLVDKARPSHVEEHIILIGDDPQWRKQATAKGFKVHVVTHEELDQHYHIKAAPLLIIMDENDKIMYSGGYTSRKQGLDIQDISILSQLQTDDSAMHALPLFGCAVSRQLQKTVDPTGLF